MSPDSYEIEWAESALQSPGRLPEKVAVACVEFDHRANVYRTR